MFKYFIYLSMFVILVQSDNYTLYKVSQQRGAACIDGSPPGLYITEGTGQNKNNFLIAFGGGGFCGGPDLLQTLQDCYKRSSGGLGSTQNAKPSINADDNGILSTIKQRNPNFYDWTKIFVIYCDGTQYLSSRPQPIPYKDKLLHFRGVNNTIQIFRYLQQNYNIYNKNKIVITGISAGGIATYLWSNHVLSKTKTSKVYAIPDSGLFLTSYVSPIYNKNILLQRAQTMINITMSQTTRYPIEQCLDKFDNDHLQCLNAAHLIRFIKVPLLMIQSPYDSWPIQNLIGAKCLTNKYSPYSLENCNQTVREYIDMYSRYARQAIKQMIKYKPDTGVWGPSCVQHGFSASPDILSPKFKVPSETGYTINDAIQKFLQDPQNPPVYLDQIDWPGNKGCSGLPNRQNLRVFQNQIY